MDLAVPGRIENFCDYAAVVPARVDDVADRRTPLGHHLQNVTEVDATVSMRTGCWRRPRASREDQDRLVSESAQARRQALQHGASSTACRWSLASGYVMVLDWDDKWSDDLFPVASCGVLEVTSRGLRPLGHDHGGGLRRPAGRAGRLPRARQDCVFGGCGEGPNARSSLSGNEAVGLGSRSGIERRVPPGSTRAKG